VAAEAAGLVKTPDPVRQARKKARHKRFDRCMTFGLVAAGALVWLVHTRAHAETRAALAAGGAALTFVIGLTTFIVASWVAHRRRRTHLARSQPRRRRGWDYTRDETGGDLR
jgi:hypothetical protein